MDDTFELQPGVNRVEVVDATGLAYMHWRTKGEYEIALARQDNGRTLKVFIRKRVDDH